MAEQDPIKVYELAKELGLDSISLLDQLNRLNIRVKSHMSELDTDQLRVARSTLGKKEAVALVKKTAVKVRKKAATPSETTAATAPATEISPDKKSQSTIIRRRAKATDLEGEVHGEPHADGETVSTAASQPPPTQE